MPFIILVVLAAALFFGWRSLNNFFIDDRSDALNERVFLNIEIGSVKAMTSDQKTWRNAPDKIYLYSDERLKTSSDSRVTLTFADNSLARLDSETEVFFKKLKDQMVELRLDKGQLWVKQEPITDPNGYFNLKTTDYDVELDNEAIFNVNTSGNIGVIKGTLQVNVKDDNKVIKTYTLGVGQEMVVDEALIEELVKGNDRDTIAALDDTVKSSEWWGWNMRKDGLITFDEPEPEDEEEGESDAETDESESEPESEEVMEDVDFDGSAIIIKPKAGYITSKSTVTLEGKYDPTAVENLYVQTKKATLKADNTWKIIGVSLNREGENHLTIETENAAGQRKTLDPFTVIFDQTPPDMPQVTEPGVNSATVTIEDVVQIIKGSVSADTEAVIVNDYRLGMYVPGSKEFQYNAKTVYNNLKVGENEYLIYAEDKAGNQSEPAKITLVLDQEVVDGAGETTDDEDNAEEAPLPAAESSGGVSITSPNGGESFVTSETEFEISGVVPSSTSKVVVNDYKLSLYNAGDTTWKYKAYKSLGNLLIGQKNTYTVKAYDSDDNEIGSASITIDVESGSNGAPAITMPTTEPTYSTTLDELVLGGTVGKWAQAVYINDEKLTAYIPGSEKWSKTVSLEAGENTYSVYSKRDGDKSASRQIVITYQP